MQCTITTRHGANFERVKAMNRDRTQPAGGGYKPAAGYHLLTPLYDAGIAILTRERRWRQLLLDQIRPADGDIIVDVGCGTGSLLIYLGHRAPGAKLIGIDPDPAMLDRTRAKALQAGVAVKLYRGCAHDTATLLRGWQVNKVVSSLAFHHMPLPEKASGLEAIYAAAVPGGELHIADFGLQRTFLMRALFRAGVQVLDGTETTEPNARGILQELIAAAGFTDVQETRIVPTPLGSISLYRAAR